MDAQLRKIKVWYHKITAKHAPRREFIEVPTKLIIHMCEALIALEDECMELRDKKADR